MANKLLTDVSKSVIHTQVSDQGQSIYFTQLLKTHADDRLRVRIRSDSYVAQSYATVDVWRDDWKEVWTIPGDLMSTPASLGYKVDPNGRRAGAKESWFLLDRNKLFAIACEILETKA